MNSNKTLRNVFVWIKDGLPPARWEPPAQSAKLDQNGCVYEPHVLGIMEGQELEILNHDPVNHNVHAESRINPAWNESQPPRAEHKFKQFESPEGLFPVTCSVHPWMRSYIGVSPNPFFAGPSYASTAGSRPTARNDLRIKFALTPVNRSEVMMSSAVASKTICL